MPAERRTEAPRPAPADRAANPKPVDPREATAGLPPDVEPHQPPGHPVDNAQNANPVPGRDSRRNRAV